MSGGNGRNDNDNTRQEEQMVTYSFGHPVNFNPLLQHRVNIRLKHTNTRISFIYTILDELWYSSTGALVEAGPKKDGTQDLGNLVVRWKSVGNSWNDFLQNPKCGNISVRFEDIFTGTINTQSS